VDLLDVVRVVLPVAASRLLRLRRIERPREVTLSARIGHHEVQVVDQGVGRQRVGGKIVPDQSHFQFRLVGQHLQHVDALLLRPDDTILDDDLVECIGPDQIDSLPGIDRAVTRGVIRTRILQVHRRVD